MVINITANKGGYAEHRITPQKRIVTFESYYADILKNRNHVSFSDTSIKITGAKIQGSKND